MRNQQLRLLDGLRAAASSAAALLPGPVGATYHHLFGWGAVARCRARRNPTPAITAARPSPTYSRPRIRSLDTSWGMLAALADHVYDGPQGAVAFDWVDGGERLHVRFGDAGLHHVQRHVVISQGDDEGEFIFADEHGTERGKGILSSDGSVWFNESCPLHGCQASGAIYRLLPNGDFERQRFETRHDEIREEHPVRYAPEHVALFMHDCQPVMA